MKLPVHRIQCYDFSPQSFTCLSRSDSSLIAAARSDATIEVYDESRNFFMVARIPGSVTTSVESLSWLESRLFYTGALGRVCEIDLDLLSIKESIPVLGTHVCRCLLVFSDSIFVGNDAGFICHFSTDPLAMKHTFPVLAGKILSLACNPNELVAAGTSLGSLTILSFSGIRWTLMSETIHLKIWSLLFLNNILFSGDSRGVVSVWDVNVGGLLQSFPAHSSHVMTLVASMDNKTVFSGGADALVRRYDCRVSEDGQACWDLAGTLRGCRRDIRGLVYLPGQHYDPGSQKENLDTRFEPHRLLAVGMDARLQVLACEQPEKGVEAFANAHRTLACMVGRPRDRVTKDRPHVAALPFWPASCSSTRPDPLSFCCFVRSDAANSPERSLTRWCLFHYPDRLSLVQLARPVESNQGYRVVRSRGTQRFLRMADGVLQLAEIRPKRGSSLVSSCISANGELIAYSDEICTRILKVTVTPGKDCDKPSVFIHRLQFAEKEHSRLSSVRSPSESRLSGSNLTSSSETDTDTDDLSASEIAKFFVINQSTTESVVFPSRVKPPTNDFSLLSTELRSPSGLPSARCLVFTPDSSHLILASRSTAELLCVSVRTGKVRWQLSLTSGTGENVVVHRMLICRERTLCGFLLGLGCSDGRVHLYSAENGRLLFKTPRVPSPTGHFPLPVALAFYHRSHLRFHVSILYTNSQLSEWSIILSASDDDQVYRAAEDVPVQVDAAPNIWLSSLWSVLGSEISTTLGIIHSMAYVDENTWLLASDRYLALLIRNEPHCDLCYPAICNHSTKSGFPTEWGCSLDYLVFTDACAA
ncbi:unnamed protein product [Dicrocoelium dendriticum]|nr:unnamed protein product [Dicrocoelium dendriticum]